MPHVDGHQIVTKQATMVVYWQRYDGIRNMDESRYSGVIDQMEALSHVRVQELAGPLGRVRLTVRAIGQADGFVFCRHGAATPFALPVEEWLALPIAQESNYDI